MKPKPKDSADVLLARARTALQRELVGARKAVAKAQAHVQRLEVRLKALDTVRSTATKIHVNPGERTGIENGVVDFLRANGPTHIKRLYDAFSAHPTTAVKQALIRARRKKLVVGGDGTGMYRAAADRGITLRS